MDYEDFQRLLRGDPEALRRIYELSRDDVYHAILRILRNHEDAEECCNDVFRQLSSSLKSFDHNRQLKPWLKTVAEHHALKFLRRPRVKFERKQSSLEDTEEQFLAAGMDPERERQQHEAFEIIRSIIGSMSSIRCIQAFSLYFYEDWSYEEIACFLHVAPDTPKAMVSRALMKIRKRLDEEFPGYL